MNHLALVAVCLFLNYPVFAQKEHAKDVQEWEVIKPPPRSQWKEYRRFLRLGNYSDCAWKVKRDGTKVIAQLCDDQASAKVEQPSFDTTVKLQSARGQGTSFAKVDDGWIVGYNKGEFGSAVYWFNEDGTVKRKLSNHQVVEFFHEGDRIFAIEGLAHLSMSRGSIIELSKEDSEWAARTFVTLPNAPKAIAKSPSGDYIIATSEMLLRAKLDREVSIIVPEGDWGSLYPNSIAVGSDGYVYIGMRQFVVRCRLSTAVQDIEYLVPNSTWLNTESSPGPKRARKRSASPEAGKDQP